MNLRIYEKIIKILCSFLGEGVVGADQNLADSTGLCTTQSKANP